jgi:two-component system response regulator HydG
MESLKKVAANAEYNTIVEALEQVNFNKSKAAKLLGIDRKTLYNKIALKKQFDEQGKVTTEAV